MITLACVILYESEITKLYLVISSQLLKCIDGIESIRMLYCTYAYGEIIALIAFETETETKYN